MFWDILPGIGIFFCLVHSALFSGLTIGLFGLNRLRLEVKASNNDRDALRILEVRKDANFLLATLLWGNVAANVLLTLLTDSFLTGLQAFFFSTIVITLLGEIAPQAYLSRHALRVGSLLVPFVGFYQAVLFPIARATSLFLDWWLGKEGVSYFDEAELKHLLVKHLAADGSDIGHSEGIGAINFLTLDDVFVEKEGEPIDPASIVQLPFEGDKPILPVFRPAADDPFLQSLGRSHRKWVVLTDLQSKPRYVLDADKYLKNIFLNEGRSDILKYCFRPIIVESDGIKLEQMLTQFQVHAEDEHDDVVDHDVILYWWTPKRIITGADLLGRLLRGISRVHTRPN